MATWSFGALASKEEAGTAFFEKADKFFKTVVKNGLVDYKSVKANPSTLKSLIGQIESFPIGQASVAKKKAFYINAYNLLVINSIIEEYPTKSPMNIKGFFDGIKHKVASESLTLNQLEKERLLKVTKDARLHFVLVCAAVSCPKIANFAYTPEKVESQIAARTKIALNDAGFIKVSGNKVQISEIFKWYAGDFKSDAGSITAYLNKYRSSKLPSGSKIGYYTYDWSLNAAK